MPKRKGLRGSVFRKGEWFVVSFPLPAEADERDPNTGKRLYKKLPWERYATEDDAYQRLLELNQLYRSGSFVPPEKQTVGQYLAEWLDSKRSQIRPTSVQRYRYDLEPAMTGIGNVQLVKLDRLVIERWHAWMRDQGYSTSQQARAHDKLSSALNAAVRARRIPFNVCREVPTPKHRHERGREMTAAEARLFLTTAHDPANNRRVTVPPLIWDLLLETGCRGGEALALRWSAVDLSRSEIAIETTLTKDEDGQYVIGRDPKTRASRRRVPISDALVSSLRTYKAAQNEQRLRFGTAWHDNDLVFPRPDGKPMRPHVLWQRFKRIVSIAGLPVDLTPHSLRHTAASLMIDRGVDYNVVKVLLGHESITTTLDRYSHVTTGARRSAVAALRQAIDG